ncbi:MAG: hypothetical protein ACRDHW_07345, partial [Ktedonobacteraceae bacterium]
LLMLLCRTIIASAFWLSIRAGASLKISGVAYDRGLPRTYLGMTHKRDIDPFLLVPTIIFHRGWRALVSGVYFALRGDAFTRGFLARMVVHPSWLARALHPLTLGSVLRWLGTYPIEGLQRPAEEWIREVLNSAGDLPAASILAPAFVRDFAQATHLAPEQVSQLPLSRLLGWRYHQALQRFCGMEILQRAGRRPVERRVIERIHMHLADVARCFWQGGSFFGSPEGQLSSDGRISSMHAGFHRTVRAAPPDLRVVPISLIYDFMTSGRQRIFADFAPALEYAAKLPLDELDARLRRAWLLRAHFTCTQLASGFLVNRQRSTALVFTRDDLAQAVYQQARELAAVGRHVDPQLLRFSGASKRARQYLTYVERRGLVRCLSPERWQITFDELAIHVSPREVAYNDAPLLYAYNELQDLLSVSMAEN